MPVLPSEYDLGPRLAGAIRNAMVAKGGDIVAAGPIVEEKMAQWAEEVAEPIVHATAERQHDTVVTSLFGVEVVRRGLPPWPCAVINSTFYLGPKPARPLEEDIGARAVPLLSSYARPVSDATWCCMPRTRYSTFASIVCRRAITMSDRLAFGSLQWILRDIWMNRVIGGCSHRLARRLKTTCRRRRRVTRSCQQASPGCGDTRTGSQDAGNHVCSGQLGCRAYGLSFGGAEARSATGFA